MIDYLSLDSTRKLLGVDSAVPTGFVICNGTVSHAFTTALDVYHETYTHVSQLLERGIRVLVYAGTHDWICNWISNEIWTLKMPWSGQEAFASHPLTNWLIDGRVVGKTRSANGLTFATVNEAGHMVGSSSRVSTCTHEGSGSHGQALGGAGAHTKVAGTETARNYVSTPSVSSALN